MRFRMASSTVPAPTSSTEEDSSIHDIEPMTSTQLEIYKEKTSVLGFDPYSMDIGQKLFLHHKC